MAYTKTTWVNNSTPAINDTNLNNIEDGIEDAHGFSEWQTEDSAHTATSGENINADTDTVGAWSLTLPATPSAGDWVRVRDAKGTFATANLTVLRNGSNIRGVGSDLVLDTNWYETTLVYVDATTGWNYEVGGGSGGGLSAWQAKTANYTAVNGDRLLCDTQTTGAFTVTLPASPSAGDEVTVSDAVGYCATNNLTVDPGSENIRGVASTLTVNTNWPLIEFVYVNASVGWKY